MPRYRQFQPLGTAGPPESCPLERPAGGARSEAPPLGPARYRGFKLPLCQPPAARDNRHRCLRSPHPATGAPARKGGTGACGRPLPPPTRSPGSAAGAARGEVSRDRGTPPVPAPPPPLRSAGGFQPRFSTSTMDETSDEPPTSAVLLDNCHFSQVIFNNVEKFYVPGGDVTCYYTLTQNIVPRGKDWVGIFRVGWKTTREYYTFMWAPVPSDAHGDAAVQQQIHFKAYYLPKDDEYYQFCYVDQDGVVRGASVPFQFRAETEDDILVVTTQGEVEELELQNKNLLKENEELKASCASLEKQNSDLQEELNKAKELQSSLESLRSNTEKLELELNSLKEKNKHLKDLDDCRQAELHQLKEQMQNVTSDKEHLETRLKTALDHMDQLQSQVLNYEKEVENLSFMDHEKTEQLKSLKEENRQLRVTATQQQQNHNLMKELEEQKRLFQILQTKKNEADEENQKLREENEVLKRLLEAGEVSSFSVVSQAQAPSLGPREGDLLFGSPYCAAGASPGAGAADLASIRKCPICDVVFPEDVETSRYEAHVQSHLLECPLCSEAFEKSKKQVFDDHIFCHGLE